MDEDIIEEFYVHCLKRGRLDGNGGLSPSTVRRLKVPITGALSLALRNKLITYNSANNAETSLAEKPRHDYYTMEELNILFDRIKGKERLYHVIKITAFYGLRRSEVLGLKWNAIDFSSNIFTINHTMVQGYNLIEGRDKTKNESSRRSFPLVEEMRELLLELRAEEVENRKVFKASYSENDYVFKWENGTPYRPDYISAKWKQIVTEYAMEKKITFHQLRHSCASMLLKLGFSLPEVSEWCGHSSIQITKDTYGHLDFDSKVDLAKGMAESLSTTKRSVPKEESYTASKKVSNDSRNNIINFTQICQSRDRLGGEKWDG